MKFEEALAYMRKGGYVKLSGLRDVDAVTIKDGCIPESLLSSDVIVEGSFEIVVPTFGFVEAVRRAAAKKRVRREHERWKGLDINLVADGEVFIRVNGASRHVWATEIIADDWYEVIE